MTGYDPCASYVHSASPEVTIESWLGQGVEFDLVVSEGFEERCTGVVRRLLESQARVRSCIIAKYQDFRQDNTRYTEELVGALRRLSSRFQVVENNNTGLWVAQALSLGTCPRVLVDITALSNRALFGALDAAAASARDVLLGYSEATTYWPRLVDWETLEADLDDPEQLAQKMDDKPWLFGHAHDVELVPNHEGYDSPGLRKALVAYLPFKCARLAAIVGEDAYSTGVFIAGIPRLEQNAWRVNALKQINATVTGDARVVEVPTFGYRRAISELCRLLTAGESPLLENYNIHVASLGSKLQNVGTWVVSELIPSITILTSTPHEYYPQAFSEGIGESWVIPLLRPKDVLTAQGVDKP